jgi:triacylglycerol esterase/lipase EstA (alpha/beta hydrolase family)
MPAHDDPTSAEAPFHAAAEANPLRTAGLFVGRHADVAQLESLLREGRSALLIGGRRAGKTTVVRRLAADRTQRTLITTDVMGWDLDTQAAGLGALRSALEGLPTTAYPVATRNEIVEALEAASPISLVIDEADRLLLASWGPAFYSFLRWLDDAHLRESISILLVGGPALMRFRDPDDKGSPPLNTAEPRYIRPLERDAVLELAQLAGKADEGDKINHHCGGHAWLTTGLLARMWEGASLSEASDDLFNQVVHTFKVWEQQLGEDGQALLRALPGGGVALSDFKQPPWTQYNEAAVYSLSIGAIRRDATHVRPGPRIFTDWFLDGEPQDRPITHPRHIRLRSQHGDDAVSGAPLRSTTLVTIHGYWSSPTTWERLNDRWRADAELDGLRIHPFGYESPKMPKLPFSPTRVPDYDDIAQTLAVELITVLADASEIAIVTHSQGGLILQRFLAWMVQQGRARELSRIRSVMLLASPNGGAQYLESVRHALGYNRRPQAANLEVLNKQTTDTQRTVLERIVNATGLDDYQCRIPFHVYAGASDNIVPAASAQAAFPGAATLAGSHATILEPAVPGNRTAEIVKHHLLADLAARASSAPP